MTMDPILNELSLTVPAGEQQSLDDRMRQFVAVLQGLFRAGAARVLRSTRDAITREVAPRLSLSQWLRDRRTLRDEKRLLQTLLSKAPFVEELLRGEEPHDLALEFRLGDQPSPGLGVAYLLESPAVSVATSPLFKQSEIKISMLCFRADGTEEAQDVTLPQFALRDHVEHRKGELLERVFREVPTGSILWARRHELLPNLDFCTPAERALCALSGNELAFREICRHLYTLNDALEGWTEGAFNPSGIEWSHESKQTLAHSRYGPQHRFLCPDGQSRTFSAKSKIRFANFRIYFEAIPETRRALIAYIGPHLGTVNYPT